MEDIKSQLEKYLDFLLKRVSYPDEIKLEIANWFFENDFNELNENPLTSLLLEFSAKFSRIMKDFSNIDDIFNDFSELVLNDDAETYIEFIKSHLERYDPPKKLKKYVDDFVNYLKNYLDEITE